MTLAPVLAVHGQRHGRVLRSGTPWVLNSTAINFGTNGVTPNQVVCLSAPKSQYPGGGDLLAIDSVIAGTRSPCAARTRT